MVFLTMLLTKLSMCNKLTEMASVSEGHRTGAGEGIRKVSLKKEISSSPSSRSCDGQPSTKGTLQGSGGVKKKVSSRKKRNRRKRESGKGA